jgi:G:T-mismatch repair DNA endonuclease (very short patch repair protein)
VAKRAARNSRFKHKVTGIEKKVAATLSELNIKFLREHYIGNYPVDFYIPEYNLSIQSDGCYFHLCEKCYKNKKASSRQLFQQHRDKACLTYHKYCRISLVRIRECTINKKNILSIIKGVIEQIRNGEIVYEQY